MSYIIDGARGRDWQGANWIFRSMCETLKSALHNTEHAEEIVERLQETINTQTGYLDLSDLLESPDLSLTWLSAIDKTIAELRKRGNKDWHKPEEFESFLMKVAELRHLAITNQPV